MPVNLTPAHLRCAAGYCPSVTRLDDGRLEIRGELITIHETLVQAGGHQVKSAEATIVISPDLLADYVAQANGESLRDRAADELSPQERSSPCGSASLSQGELAVCEGDCPPSCTFPDGPCVRQTAHPSDTSAPIFDPLECSVLREEIAAVVDVVARDGLPGPRDLDVALDAILCSVDTWVQDARAAQRHFSERGQSPKGGDGEAGSVHADPVCEANSPEILHLRSQVAKLKQALDPFSAALDGLPSWAPDCDDNTSIWDSDACQSIKYGDLRRARAALTEEDKENG